LTSLLLEGYNIGAAHPSICAVRISAILFAASRVALQFTGKTGDTLMRSLWLGLPFLVLFSSTTNVSFGQTKSLETDVDTFYGSEIDSFAAFPFFRTFPGHHDLHSSISGRPLDSLGEDSPAFGNGTASIHAQAHAEVGHIGVGITIAATATETDYVDANAAASASWQDNAGLFTETLPVNALAVARFNVFLEGDLHAVAFGDANANGIFTLHDNNLTSSLPADPYPDFHAWGFIVEAPAAGVHIVDQIPGGFRITKTILNKQFFTLGFGMDLRGQVVTSRSTLGSQLPGSAAFSGDIMHSIRWGGIDSITDASGNEIPRNQWSFISDSGFDYSQPFSVPEPTSIILATIASAASCLLRPERSRR
jgi:hypothetical protein